ncbi:14548_t:CDS:1, partial [Racocetra persica]
NDINTTSDKTLNDSNISTSSNSDIENISNKLSTKTKSQKNAS